MNPLFTARVKLTFTMVKACCVYRCKSISSRCNESFFSFPKNQVLFEQWKKIIPKKGCITKYSFICNKHFQKSYYENIGKKRILKKDAIPTIFECDLLENTSLLTSQCQNQDLCQLLNISYTIPKHESSIAMVDKAISPERTETKDVATSPCILKIEETISIEKKGVATEISPWQLLPSTKEELRRKIRILQNRLRRREAQFSKIPELKFFKKRASTFYKEQHLNMPPKRTAKAKADSSKAKSEKKTDVKETSKKKRGNDASDEPASKKTKTEPKESKKTNTETKAAATKKAKDEPKQVQNKIDTNLDEIDFECMKSNKEGKKYNLKICTWNVSGIRAVIKKNGIDYIAKEDADIVALQETKCDKDKLPDEVKLSGYHHYFLDSKKSGYCGVALFCKEKPISVKYGLNNSNFDSEGRIITAEFPEFFMVNVYVPNAGQKLVTLPKRLEWNKIFKKHIEELDEKKPVIICGDMNVAHQEIDLKNPKTNTKNAGFTKEERDGMTDFLAAGFVDTFRILYPDMGGAYTFWSYFANARNKDIGWRLDYFLVSERVKNKVCDNIIRKQVYGSDHCPVILYANL